MSVARVILPVISVLLTGGGDIQDIGTRFTGEAIGEVGDMDSLSFIVIPKILY